MAKIPYSYIPEDIKKETAAEEPKKSGPREQGQKQAPPASGKPANGPFKRKRAGLTLSRDEVREIKKGRKKLRREMKARGIRSRQEFELVAGSMGLYFDKGGGFLLWLLHGRALWALAGALVALLAAFFLMSLVSQMRGYFTINLSSGMFREGFVLSETEDFQVKTVNLTCEPAVDVPCISIAQIPEDVDAYEGTHNADYFAYTFFLRNEGDTTVDYAWQLELNDEAKNLRSAAWVMVFEDGNMAFYAQPNENGKPEALPAFDDNSRGYTTAPLMDRALNPDQQYEVIRSRGPVNYYRLIPLPFASESAVTSGYQKTVAPQDVHKYTVVIWLEGDDPDCTNDLVGGHLGLDLQFRLVSEGLEASSEETGKSFWQSIWNNLKWMN